MSTNMGALVERSARLDVNDLDFGAFADRPLDESTLRCLRYMHDVECHTMCYLRDVLVTRVHADPEVTAFLACWCYEEHWHGEAIARILAVHGEPAGPERVAAMRRSLPARDRLQPLLYLVGSSLTSHIVTAHMTWGAVNEWTTQAGYGRLAAKSGHPVLAELLRRIMKQEGRHIDFYAGQARRRLESSRMAQRLTRVALRRYWTPVGAGVMPGAEVDFLIDHLFGGAEGLAVAQRIDRQVDRLPGLSGLGLVERAVEVAAGRVVAVVGGGTAGQSSDDPVPVRHAPGGRARRWAPDV
ncbi:MAG: ferritin-like domain-containing protein [Acidimicrobiales bacterium]